jgi:integrase
MCAAQSRNATVQMAPTNGVAYWAPEVSEIVTPHRCDREHHIVKMFADLKAGTPDGAFIFSGDCNGFMDPDQFGAEAWKPIAEKAGMAGTRFDDLRHFFASQLIAQSETTAYFRDQMGHSSIIKVTFDTYGHLFTERRPVLAIRLAIEREEGPEGTVTN